MKSLRFGLHTILFFSGLVMGRLWWTSPSIFHGMGRGPARPIKIFIWWAAARPGPSFFQRVDGLCTGWPSIPVGRPVDLTGRATGRPICFPVLKGEGICADVLFRCFVRSKFVFRFFPSGFRRLAREPHIPTTSMLLQHQIPAVCRCNTGCCNTSCYRSVIRKEQK